jgi:uncharacterized lipoprotein YajG
LIIIIIIKDHSFTDIWMDLKKGEFMSKYLVLAAAMIVLAVACNKKEETSTETTAPTVEQTAPATETAPEAAPAADTAAPADAAHGTEAAPAEGEAHQ